MLINICSCMVPMSHMHCSCIAVIANEYLVKYFLAASEKEFSIRSVVQMHKNEFGYNTSLRHLKHAWYYKSQ